MSKKLSEMNVAELMAEQVIAIKAGDRSRELSIYPIIDALSPPSDDGPEPTECGFCGGYDDTCDFCGDCADCGHYVVTDCCPKCGCRRFAR